MPSEEKLELRVPLTKLLVGLLIAVGLISLLGLYSISLSDRALERQIGSHFRTIAQSTAASVSQFIHDRVIEVAQFAADPAVVEAVTAANRAYTGLSDDAVAAKIQKIDQTWNTPASAPIAQTMLVSPASRALRHHQELDPRVLRITVTDEKGATVAASHKTLDYFQADEEYWQNIYASGRGAISVTDVLYDEATKESYLGIGVPVVEKESNRFIGTLDALIDVSSLFPIVNRVQIGGTGRTLLVKEDGMVISAPQVNLSMRVKSDEFAAVRDALTTVRGREDGYVVADIGGSGSTLIGFADTELKNDYQQLGWTVLACQASREAFSPIRFTGRLLAFMSVIGLFSVVFMAVYVALHRKQRFEDIGEVHPPREAPVEPRPAAPQTEPARRA